MSDFIKQKTDIEAEFTKINQTNKIIVDNLTKAKESGDNESYQSLIGDLRTMKEREDFLQNQYTSILDQEAKPKQEKIAQLGTELKTPYQPNPQAGYSPYGFGFPMGAGMTGSEAYKTKEQDTQRKRDIIAQVYNAPVNEKGRASEQLPAGVRGGVGALPTQESKLEYLQRTYPNSNIAPIDVGGNTEYLIKNQDGTSFTTLDKGIAGTAGMLAVETPIAIAETAAGLGTLAATKSPVMATLAAGGTRAAIGPIADSITRAALGMPQKVGESIERRGVEAAIGTAIGLGIDIIPASVIAARTPSNFNNEFLKAYKESFKRLGLEESLVPAGAQFGKQGLETAQELGAKFPRSGIAGNFRKAQEGIRTLFEGLKKEIPATANDFGSIAVNLDGQRRAFANSIARTNDKNSLLIEDTISQILKPKSAVNIDELGGIIRNTVASAEKQSIDQTDAQYKLMSEIADNAGFQITAKNMLNIVPEIKRRINVGGSYDEAAVRGVENRLREVRDAPGLISAAYNKLEKATGLGKIQDLRNEIKRLEGINKPLDFNSFDGYIKEFNNARPDGGAVGGNTKDVFGSRISSELSDFRRKIYRQFNETLPDGTVRNLGDEFQKATELVKARQAFEGNTLGGILKEVVGEQATTPRDIVSSVMKEPFTINRVLQASKELEASNPAQTGITQKLQQMMGNQYLSDIGIGSQKGIARLNYDQGMLESLYGTEAKGVARGLDALNDKLKVLRSASVPDMTLTDLNQLSSALSQDARDEVALGIIKRDTLKKQEEELVRSSVFKAAQKGDFKNVDPDLLSKSILSKSSSIGQAESSMLKLSQSSPESRNLFKGDFMRNLLEQYPGGTPSAGAPYTPLFDAKKLLADWESPIGKSPLFKKAEIVLGQDKAQYIYDLAKAWSGSSIPDITAKGGGIRTIGSLDGLNFVIPIGSMASSVRNRYLAAVLSTGTERYGLKSALARNALPGEVNDIYVKMFKRVFTTREGITALSNQAASDPEFSAELQNSLREFNKKEGLNTDSK